MDNPRRSKKRPSKKTARSQPRPTRLKNKRSTSIESFSRVKSRKFSPKSPGDIPKSRPSHPQKNYRPSSSRSAQLLSTVRRQLKRLSKRQKFMLAAILVAAFAGSVLIFTVNDDTPNTAVDSDGLVASSQLSQLERGTPDYQTLTPANRSAGELEWSRVSPEGVDPVYAYADNINNTSIAVSQQPLPEDFKGNTNERVEELALDFGAAESIKVDGTTIYIGATAQGQQSLIFTKQDLLILIKTTDTIPKDELSSYITSLQ